MQTLAAEKSDEQKLRGWVETNLGADVLSVESQKRWRPAWFIDARIGGQTVKLYARGARTEDFPRHTIDYEEKIYKVLGEQNFPVPKCYGLCPDPYVLVMDCHPGTHLLRENSKSEEDRVSVLRQLAEVYARFHTMDVTPFIDVGVEVAESGMAALFPHWSESEEYYLKYKKRPDPRAEFFRSWVHRNAPPPPSKLTFIHGDPGQFLFEGDRVSAVIDFELASLGDPMLDLAGIRNRAIYEPMGDIRAFYERYCELTGTEIDKRKIGFYAITTTSATTLLVSDLIHSSKSARNLLEYLSWYVNGLISVFKTMAELGDFQLKEPEPITPSEPRWESVIEKVGLRCAAKISDSETDYDLTVAKEYMEFVWRLTSRGPILEEEYVRETEKLVGKPLSGWRDADRELEDFIVGGSGPEHDRAIIDILHRWACRQRDLLRGLSSSDGMVDLTRVPLKEL